MSDGGNREVGGRLLTIDTGSIAVEVALAMFNEGVTTGWRI